MKGGRTLEIALVALVLALVAGLAQAQGPQPAGGAGPQTALGTAFTYQGQLKQYGNPVNGTCDFRFTLYDAADAGTSLGTQTKTGISVTNGLFTIPDLDFGTDAFQGDARWLQIEVKCAGDSDYVPLSPRQALTAAPYALSLRPGAYVQGALAGTFIPGTILAVRNTATSNLAYGVAGWSDSSNGAGVHGEASATAGTAYGVEGYSYSPGGAGVYGWARATTGTNYGVYGLSASTAGRGVYGIANAASGTTIGVFGESRSTAGFGVFGYAGATSGVTFGVAGQSESTEGRGVNGYVGATTGQTYGVHGESRSTSGTGVYGWASATTGITFGVWGRSDSTDGIGVYGLANAAGGVGMLGYAYANTGGGVGVWGQTNAPNGHGVSGWALSTSGGHGVYAHSWAPAEGGAALYALNTHTGGIAMWGQNNSTDSTLVLVNQGTGDLLKAFISGGELRFRFQNDGWAYADGGWTTPAADLAELLPAAPGLEPGDVLVVGADGKLARSTQAYQPTVVGVYSTRPGFVGGQPMEGKPEGHIPLAVVGVVPVKASAENGPIRPGDLLVASATPGHAMRAGPNPPIGTVIGKALEGLEKGTGVIRMLVILQ